MKKRILCVCVLLTIISVNSQTTILKDNGSWLTFTNKVKLSNKFYFTNVTQQRRVGFLKETQGYLIAPAINYKLSDNVSIGVGYLFYKYFPNGASHSSIHKNENRYFQDINLSSVVGKFSVSNRLMFEERVIELINTDVTPNVIDGDKYVNRFRYRLQVTTNLLKLKNEKYIMGKLSNEVRIRFAGGGIGEPDFDQNNFEALLGYKLLSNSVIWMGYGKYYFKSNSTQYVSENILHVTLSYDFDLAKKK